MHKRYIGRPSMSFIWLKQIVQSIRCNHCSDPYMILTWGTWIHLTDCCKKCHAELKVELGVNFEFQAFSFQLKLPMYVIILQNAKFFLLEAGLEMYVIHWHLTYTLRRYSYALARNSAHNGAISLELFAR